MNKISVKVDTWIHINEGLPEDGTRVLAYSPSHEGTNSSNLTYRMLPSFMMEIANDVEYWMIPSAPDTGIWINCEYDMPMYDKSATVITYSPVFKNVDDSLLYRIMNTTGVKSTTSASDWKIITPPSK